MTKQKELGGLGAVLKANVTALMRKKYGKVVTTRLAEEPGMSVGVAGRVQSGQNIELKSLEAMAKAFDLQPWQLLYPGLDPEALPSGGESGASPLLEYIDEKRFLALSEKSRGYVQGYAARAIEDMEAREKRAA